MLEILELNAITDEVVAAFARLIPQLSLAAPPGRQELEEILASQSSTLWVAKKAGQIIGTLTLVVFRTPTGRHAWIEDVVVDAAERRQGIGEALTRAALQRAADLGIKAVDLTSRPSRQEANQLYLRLGFKLRQTNLYRFNL